jgi:hypothetical protein
MRPVFKVCLIVALTLAGLGSTVYPLCAQGLGDVARQEEERRKDIKKPAKVYTNKDLASVPESASATLPSPAPAADGTKTPAKTDADDKDKGKDKADKDKGPKKDQAYWSGRKKELQTRLDTDQTMSDALQSRINALTTDFVNRDDPIQRAGIEKDRLKALSELERVKKSIVEGKKALADLDEEARKAGVPSGWLR